MCLYYLLITNVLPDPKMAYWQIREMTSESEKSRRENLHRELDHEFSAYFSQHLKRQGLGCLCHGIILWSPTRIYKL